MVTNTWEEKKIRKPNFFFAFSGLAISCSLYSNLQWFWHLGFSLTFWCWINSIFWLTLDFGIIEKKCLLEKKKPLGKVFFQVRKWMHFLFFCDFLPLCSGDARSVWSFPDGETTVSCRHSQSVKVRFLHAICNCFSFSLWWSENSKKFGFCTTFFQVISSLWWITTFHYYS